MVKSYVRYELAHTFGVVASHSNSVYIPPEPPAGKKAAGRVITGGLEEILIWNIKTGELTQRLRDGVAPGSLNSTTQSPPPQVQSLAFNALSNIVAAGYSDGSIKIWDLTSGSVVIDFQGHKSAVTVLQFNGSGTSLVSGSRDTTVIVWDLVGERGLYKLKGHRDQITGMQFLTNPDSDDSTSDDWLVTTSKDGLIKLWDLKSQQCVETHVAHSGECWSLAVNESQSLCVTCGMENQGKLWKIDLAAETKIQEEGAFEKQSKHRGVSCEFHHTATQGDFFYIGNNDRMVEVFRIRSEHEITKATSRRTKRLREKGATDEEIKEALAKSKVSMLVAPFTAIYADKAKVRSVCWGQISSQKQMDLVVTLTNNTVVYYEVDVPESVRKHKVGDKISRTKYTLDQLGHRHDIRAVDISEDDSLIVTGSKNQLKVWNVKRQACIRSFEWDNEYVICAKFLPGGSLVVVGTKEGGLLLVDLASSRILDSILEAHEGKTTWSIDLSPDGKTIVTGGADKTVKFWQIQVTQELVPGTEDKYKNVLKLDHTRTLELNDEVLNVKISPDSKYIAVALMDNTVKVFFYDTLKFYLSLYGHKLPVLSIDISFDSKTIITSAADKNIRIWGLDFGDCHRSIFGHQDSIMTVKFLPESTNFISCSKDGMVKYWDGIKFECVQKLAAHQSEVWNVAVSNSGDFFVSVSHDTSIRTWEKTDDQVFIEEEREREMDETYENELLASLEGGNGDDIGRKKPVGEEGEEGNNDGVSTVTKQTMEKLKAGEKLMEALDLAWKDISEMKEYEEQVSHSKEGGVKPVKPEGNALLTALRVSPQKYVLDTLMQIKPSQLDDALLVLPFSYTIRLFHFIRLWTDPKKGEGRSGGNVARICRTLFFAIRANSMELVSQKDSEIQVAVQELRVQLRDILNAECDDLGYNIAGLRYIQQEWKENHSHVLEEKQESEKSRKRVYTTIG